MILSVCPNPCIDCTMELDNLNVGKLNRIDSKIINYSGKALNVAVGAARLGENVTASGFMFENDGALFEQSLIKEGVKPDFVYSKGSVRVNYKIIDKKSMLTEINDSGERVDEDKQTALVDKVKELSRDAEIVVMSGSLPKGVDPVLYRRVFEGVGNNAIKLCDTEKDNLLEALKCGIDLIKPNLSELENVFGRTMNSKQDIIDSAHKLIDLGAKAVIVSLGVDGAIYTNGNKQLYSKSMNVAVNSTVGAGDAMLSAAAVAIKRGVDEEELLKMAVSAGTAAVTTSGSNLFYKNKYDEIYEKVKVERL